MSGMRAQTQGTELYFSFIENRRNATAQQKAWDPVYKWDGGPGWNDNWNSCLERYYYYDGNLYYFSNYDGQLMTSMD